MRKRITARRVDTDRLRFYWMSVAFSNVLIERHGMHEANAAKTVSCAMCCAKDFLCEECNNSMSRKMRSTTEY